MHENCGISMTEEHGTIIIPSKIHNDRKITIDSKRVITELHILTENKQIKTEYKTSRYTNTNVAYVFISIHMHTEKIIHTDVFKRLGSAPRR